jgi:cob(I)alamin adenosyltransferase
MSKIYTRTGDSGETGLFGGGRVRKDHVRIAACGTIDELNAVLGVARGALGLVDPVPTAIREFINRVQHQLFNLGAELATPDPEQHGTVLVQEGEVAWLEQSIDAWEQQLEPLTTFILPGGCPAAAQLHWARTICRRAERLATRLSASEPIRGEVLRYVNRLSDALFVAARTANRMAGVADVKWQRDP